MLRKTAVLLLVITTLLATQVSAMDSGFEPAYLKLHRSGELKKRGETLWESMKSCRLCPRDCRVDRLSGQKGFCGASSQLMVASAYPHFGEEEVLVGTGGSGAIFFSNCGLRCVFCINWDISHKGAGDRADVAHLAELMLLLQKRGCHNINVVTPTHYLPHILLALDRAATEGLRLPVAYNTCGWERPEILKALDGVVDIYLPDFKYWDPAMADTYSPGAAGYPKAAKEALREMHRQVGTARPAADGIVYRGLIIRHLVMPNDVAGSKEIVTWIAENLPKDTYLNIMSQYTPVYRAREFPKINRRITREEYREVIDRARELGLTNLDIQGGY